MKKLLILPFLLLSGLFLSGCTLTKSPAALQIETNPVANVFIDGQLMGKTPYSAKDAKVGDVQIKLIPESSSLSLSSWEGKVKLVSGVLTLISRDFGTSENVSSGEILTLEKTNTKKPSVSIISTPDGASVSIDGESKGVTPQNIDSLTAGDHEFTLSKDGFSSKSVKAKTVEGYKLIIDIKLGQSTGTTTDGTTTTATQSGSLTPPPKAGTTPPTTSGTTETMERPYVVINKTETGWLRVRADASSSGAEVAKVNPGEKYALLDSKSGWVKIKLSDGKEGWVSGAYVTKYE